MTIEKHNSRLKNRTGEVFKSNDGYNFTIIKYINANNCSIQFENGIIVNNKEYSKIIRGQVSNPYNTNTFGIGFLGEGKYTSSKENHHAKIYNVWRKMLERCYSQEQVTKFPTYKECSVTEEWHNYQNFAKWYEENFNTVLMQDWELDKDILIKGNKIYSPETCCLVPPSINIALVKRDKKRGICPIGVHVEKRTGRYISRICKGTSTKTYLGTFNTPEEAFQAYKIAKEAYIKEIADK